MSDPNEWHIACDRDGSGRITGTVSTDSNGTKTYRDNMGRITGTATTNSNGTVTYRDGTGRTTGTATARADEL
jgi:YD repeat-containing protein